MRRGIVVAFTVITLLLMALAKYTFQGIHALNELYTPASDAISNGYLLWVAICPVLLLLGFIKFDRRRINRFQSSVATLFLAEMVALILGAIVLFAGTILQSLGHALGAFESGGINIYVACMMAGVIIYIFGAFIYGMIKGKYRYRIHRHRLEFEALPEAFDGFTILQISDVHAGSFDHFPSVEKGIHLINDQQPDLFVFTGDLVNNMASEFEPWIELFSRISAPFGKYSILGNHDYGDYISWNNPSDKIENLETLKHYHKLTGFRLLLDEGVSIEKDGEKIYLLGVENWGIGFGKRGNLSKALDHAHPQGFKILLSHDPSHWDAEVKQHSTHIHLTLSGHTHGMQFGIDRKWLRWSPVKYRYRKWAGMYAENERFLHVNRGFGFLGLSARVGIWPEITLIELKRK